MDAEATTWACARCTLINDASASACTVCGAIKPRPPRVPGPYVVVVSAPPQLRALADPALDSDHANVDDSSRPLTEWTRANVGSIQNLLAECNNRHYTWPDRGWFEGPQQFIGFLLANMTKWGACAIARDQNRDEALALCHALNSRGNMGAQIHGPDADTTLQFTGPPGIRQTMSYDVQPLADVPSDAAAARVFDVSLLSMMADPPAPSERQLSLRYPIE